MASASNDQELLPEQTEGFKVGEKKTMDEYNKLGECAFGLGSDQKFVYHISNVPSISIFYLFSRKHRLAGQQKFNRTIVLVPPLSASFPKT